MNINCCLWFLVIYIKNKIGTELMRKANLWSLLSFYTEAKISNTSAGVVLFCCRSRKLLFKKQGLFLFVKTILLKRIKTYNSKHDNLFLSAHNKIYEYIVRFSGLELSQKLSRIINLDSYLKFIALNSLLG